MKVHGAMRCFMSKDQQTPSEIMKIAAVAEYCAVSKATVYRLMKAGRFPKSISLVPGGRRVGWRASDVRKWAEEPLAWDYPINF